jgi:hypothetical protein
VGVWAWVRAPLQAAANASQFCASGLTLTHNIDTNLCISGGPTSTQPTWTNVRHIINTLNNTVWSVCASLSHTLTEKGRYRHGRVLVWLQGLLAWISGRLSG